MTPRRTIRALAAQGEQAAEEERRDAARKLARIAWVRDTMAALKAAQDKVDAAWDRILADIPDDMPDEEFEALGIPEPSEQAELDAIFAQLHAVRDQDKWPRHLYWGDV